MSSGAEPFDLASLITAHDEGNFAEAVVPPIFQTSLFTFSDYDEMIACYRGEKLRPIYTRGLNPTVRAFEEMLAKLEGAEDALGFASGMAAISSAVLSFVEPGDRIVAVKHVYPDAFRLFGTILKRMKIKVTYVDGRDEEAVARALPGAKIFYMESPTSWVMEAHDVGALAALARRHGVVSMIDNSWASPFFQRPLTLGVDLVIHSASKYLGGHSDVVAGLSLSRRQAFALRCLASDPRSAHAAAAYESSRGLRPRNRPAPAAARCGGDGLPSRPRQPSARRPQRHLGPVFVHFP
jgi:cystathionine gamma-synthase